MQTQVTDLLGIALPIVQAPMAGVSTPAMAAAVSNAGGLGNIAIGHLAPQAAAEAIRAVQAATDRPFGVNLFTHATPQFDAEVNRRWLERLRRRFREFGAQPPGDLTLLYSSFNDDPGLLEVVLETRPPVVSCHFGLPTADRIAAVKGYGGLLLGTVTNVTEAIESAAAGLDAVVAQGYEAGGHRGAFFMYDDDCIGTLALVPQVASAVSLPVIAAGGIADGRGIAAALALGAGAAQLGTAYIPCPESAAGEAYRALLASERSQSTVVTAVISGRPARTIRNRFYDEFHDSDDLVPPYPIAYDAGKALAAAASNAGSAEFSPTWAGQHVARGRALPAGELTERLAEETRAELARLGRLAEAS